MYHVMMRGLNRDAIFLEDEDFEDFLRALRETKAASGCAVLAYCLMTNHVHLVLRADREPIGVVMKRLGVRYAGRFNRKYGRVGHLFQDRFRSEPVEDDGYLTTLLPYIWNNPVVAGMVSRPEDYRWSSRRWLGSTSPLLDHDVLGQLLAMDVVELADAHAADGVPRRPFDPPRFDADDAMELLHAASGVRTREEFGDLARADQCRVVRELRTRGLSYALIGRVIGRPKSTVARMQVA
ncbi:MAG: transposase [Micropruina sp.]|uniref:transposase n=1 Tax=Micropruina sp. TaxID=2737536 RepID=UPI0039E61FC3